MVRNNRPATQKYQMWLVACNWIVTCSISWVYEYLVPWFCFKRSSHVLPRTRAFLYRSNSFKTHFPVLESHKVVVCYSPFWGCGHLPQGAMWLCLRVATIHPIHWEVSRSRDVQRCPVSSPLPSLGTNAWLEDGTFQFDPIRNYHDVMN